MTRGRRGGGLLRQAAERRQCGVHRHLGQGQAGASDQGTAMTALAKRGVAHYAYKKGRTPTCLPWDAPLPHLQSLQSPHATRPRPPNSSRGARISACIWAGGCCPPPQLPPAKPDLGAWRRLPLQRVLPCWRSSRAGSKGQCRLCSLNLQTDTGLNRAGHGFHSTAASVS